MTRSVGAAGGASQLGRMTKLRPTRSARKYCFQTSRHSSSCASRRAIEIGSGETPAARSRVARRLDLRDDLVLELRRALRQDQRLPGLDPKDGLGVADLDAAGQRADGVGQDLGRADGTAIASSIQCVDTGGANPTGRPSPFTICDLARQRTTRRFASRRRRLRASRILRLRFTDGFS